MSAVPAPNPAPVEAYPGPRPFQTSEAPVFKGRDRERADLRDLVFAYRTVLLYSQSGAGKTSLIKAGLVPALDAPCVICRVGGDLPPGVDPKSIANIFAFNALASGLNDKVDARSLVARRLGDGLLSEPGYIIFDQFEELFTTYPEKWDERQPFFEQIRELLARSPDVHLVFAIREEHMAELDRYADSVPDGFRIRYHLERLREPEALQAVVEPARQFGLEAIQARASQIVTSLRRIPVQTRRGVELVEGEFIEPLHLQVVCCNLWRRLNENKQLTAAELERLTDVDRTLGDFYENALCQTRANIRIREGRLRGWCEEELITPAGTRGIVYMNAESGETCGIPNSAVESLEKQHVVRREPRAGSVWFELTHDRFIRPIQASNGAFRARRRNRRMVLAGTALVVLLAYPLSRLMFGDKEARLAREVVQQQKELTDARKGLRSALDLAARATVVTSEAPGVRARSLAGIGVQQFKLGEWTKASDTFEQARKLDPWAAMQAIDQLVAGQSGGPDVVQAERARKEFLKGVEPYLGTSPELKRYVCDRNFYVIGASEKQAAAEDERKLWLRTFPQAELGTVNASGWVPIVMDTFLTCDEAHAVMQKVRAAPPQDRKPYVRPWYDGCPRCVVHEP